MSRTSEIAKKYKMDDDDIPFIYANSADSGPIFGVQSNSFILAAGELLCVNFAPQHITRAIPRSNLIDRPKRVKYIQSYGDGTSHGATWSHFSDILRSLNDRPYPSLDEREIENYIDGLMNMSFEGMNKYGGGWEVIAEGMTSARDELYSGNSWRNGAFYEGLGLIATSFAEREDSGIAVLQAS